MVDEEGGDASLAQRIDRRLAAGTRQRAEGVADAAVQLGVVEDEGERAIAERAHVVAGRAERQLAHARMDAVGADDEIEALRGAVAERDVDAGAGVDEVRDGGAEANRGETGQRVVQHVLEIAAHEVEVAIGEQEAPQRRVRQREARMAVAVDEGELADRIVDARDRGQKAEALGGVVARAEEVDHVAFVAQAVRLLEDDDGVAGAPQAQGQRQPGDSRTHDQHLHRLPSAYRV